MNERLLREVTEKDAARIRARARYLWSEHDISPSSAMAVAVRDFSAGWAAYMHFKFVGRRTMPFGYLQEYGL